MMQTHRTRLAPLFNRSAFTLIEVMVAIFLMLLIMVGINTVFRTTSETVGAGQALSAVTRDGRAANATMTRDFTSVASDSAAFIIYSKQDFTFQNANDQRTDTNGAASDYPNPTAGSDVTVPAAAYGYRSYRLDTMSFFARDLFRRQTGGSVASGGASPMLAEMTTNEAWIWYGHLRQPNNAGVYSTTTDPAQGNATTNPNNFFAEQFMLGRVAVMLKEKDSSNQIGDKVGDSQYFVDAPGIPGPPSTTGLQAPLAYDSTATDGQYIQTARYDLASTSISGFKTRLAAYVDRGGTNFDSIFASNGRRFQADSLVVRPLTPATYSRQFPIMARGCTQFIVEYAGDFLSQNPTTGAVLGRYNDATPSVDTEIDFIVVGSGTTLQRRIRWYGMPRNVDTTDDTATDIVIVGNGTPATMLDVVPLRDVAGVTMPFEKSLPSASALANYGAKTGGMASGSEYRCVWGPYDTVRPKMIRVTITLTDSQGRLPNGQTFEYVFALR